MKNWVVFLFLSSFLSFSQSSDFKPLKTYNSDGIKIISYDFNTFEPYLHKNDGTTYVINFWATWCLPCVKELPYFEQLNEKYKNQNVKVILVSMDMPKKVETSLIPFVIKKKLQSEVLHLDDPDANAWIEKVDKNWSGAIPATVIYNDKTRKFYEQSFTYETLEKELLTIINN
ncbi:TlpA family protein disulfide reductase [Flavobacterium sp. SM15]|uniref:TlpA disulfide reductase family protein n=1 Tax=Flavobacterium sp. SM15 TaxID=2908005 RepID=UPI001EDC8DCA|nr:TlpA disulfide reductase family protein [Flavobacterium sp. SM15]MCG2612447.1 TlpA family protein disulfide reductase [Flavobacterium sp. SM15]